MEIILKKEVANLGYADEIVNVKFLLRNYIYILESKLRKNSSNRNITCTIEW